jgi:hypothetical protein
MFKAQNSKSHDWGKFGPTVEKSELPFEFYILDLFSRLHIKSENLSLTFNPPHPLPLPGGERGRVKGEISNIFG